MKSVLRRKSFITLANQITILRLFLIPPIVIAFLNHQHALALGLLIFSMITDFLDGLVARLKGERTQLGAFLDPMADKLLLVSVYLTLTYLKMLDMWVFVVIFSRDLLIVLGWALIYILTGTAVVNPRWLGKITTASQMITAVTCITPVPHDIHRFLLWIMIGLTVVSAVDYVIVGEKKLGEWG